MELQIMTGARKKWAKTLPMEANVKLVQINGNASDVEDLWSVKESEHGKVLVI